MVRAMVVEEISRAPQWTPPEDEEVMVGTGPAMRRVFDCIRRFATNSLTVLITGESGTGKEMAARALHERSGGEYPGGTKRPFIAVNCGAIPETLIASELFGHEKGAFTGASSRRIGKIELAAGGTLFLDEIGDLPLETQAHLLRFLQEGTIERVGGTATIRVRTRVVAATNVDLEKAVAQGRFREDLFFRLDILRLQMPPLRERQEDIDILIRYVVRRASAELNQPLPAIDAGAMSALRAYSWPGNVRELISVVRRAIVMADGPSLTRADFPLLAREGGGAVGPSPQIANPPSPVQKPGATVVGLNDARHDAEAATTLNALRTCGFNVTAAARTLGISRSTMYRLINRYELPTSA
ncbi:MAG: sigma-54 interaction domain-containing protein [Inquilinaceae bacterium]